jgi:transposase-like protein
VTPHRSILWSQEELRSQLDGTPRRQFTPDDKATLLRRHLADKVPVSDLCDEYRIQPSLFYLWQRQALENLSAALQDGRALRDQSRAASGDRARLASSQRAGCDTCFG